MVRGINPREALEEHLTFQISRFLTQKLYGDTPQALEALRRMLFPDSMLTSPRVPALYKPFGLLEPAPEVPASDAPLESLAPGTIVNYVVLPGDTLSTIALRFRSTVPAIAGENALPDPDEIAPGQGLRVPVNLLAPGFSFSLPGLRIVAVIDWLSVPDPSVTRYCGQKTSAVLRTSSGGSDQVIAIRPDTGEILANNTSTSAGIREAIRHEPPVSQCD